MRASFYKAHGYENREDYLSGLAEDYGLSLEEVIRPLADLLGPLAELLGPSEDFDGLIAFLEDEAAK